MKLRCIMNAGTYEPSVIRLDFHLEDEQSVIFEDQEPIDNVVSRAETKTTKFKAWFEANKTYKWANDLTYAQFPSQFVFNNGVWTPRQSDNAIGRIYYVPQACGELYYLRTLLNTSKGARSYKDLRKIDGVEYRTFKEACYALRLLEDDQEFIDALIEASSWASAVFVRQLFTTMLLSASISRPCHVWDATCMHLSDDILLKQRHITGDPGAFFIICIYFYKACLLY